MADLNVLTIIDLLSSSSKQAPDRSANEDKRCQDKLQMCSNVSIIHQSRYHGVYNYLYTYKKTYKYIKLCLNNKYYSRIFAQLFSIISAAIIFSAH